MDNNNLAIYGSKVLTEIVWGIIYFPAWWYGVGFFNFLLKLGKFIANREKEVGLLVWLKNIGKPMYGQRDVAGVLISLFIRIIQIIVRSVFMLFWLIIAIFFLIFWISLPIIVIYQLIFQLIPGF
ncbi:hypothetical protein HGA64_04150 [Candidatus Falkowbacteria bacterium]|nr:hypothetical protein [Candidatus Falkowbacteria bacterium]